MAFKNSGQTDMAAFNQTGNSTRFCAHRRQIEIAKKNLQTSFVLLAAFPQFRGTVGQNPQTASFCSTPKQN